MYETLTPIPAVLLTLSHAAERALLKRSLMSRLAIASKNAVRKSMNLKKTMGLLVTDCDPLLRACCMEEKTERVLRYIPGDGRVGFFAAPGRLDDSADFDGSLDLDRGLACCLSEAGFAEPFDFELDGRSWASCSLLGPTSVLASSTL